MSNNNALMAGKRGLVMGVANDRSIAWGIAKAVAAEPARAWPSPIRARRFGKRVRPLAESVGSDFLLDATSPTRRASMRSSPRSASDGAGSISSSMRIAFSDKEELKGQYVDTSRDNFLQTHGHLLLLVHRLCRRAAALMPQGGSLLTLTYYGAERVMPHYNVMGVAKAALEASVRYLAVDLGGQNIRVNAISAGPIKTLAPRRSAISATSSDGTS